jgi:hypothetical protein
MEERAAARRKGNHRRCRAGAQRHCRDRRAKIIALFDDDAVAKKMVLGMMDGARGEELQAISGLGKTEYESKRTKIRRRIEKFFDAGR